jgi:transposase
MSSAPHPTPSHAALLEPKRALASAVEQFCSTLGLTATIEAQARTINQQAATIKQQATENLRLNTLVEKLTFELAVLKRQLFGRSREAADALVVQGQLFPGPEVIVQAPPANEPDQPAPDLPRTPNPVAPPVKRQPIRQVIPDNLPREVRVVDLEEAAKEGLVKIGEDTSERLAYQPGKFFVLCTVRPYYAKPKDPDVGIFQQPVPPSVVPGGILDESVIAQVAVSKFADHQPLNRQVEQAARVGAQLSVSTLSENLLAVATVWLSTLVRALWVVLKQRSSLHVDETVLPTLPKRKAKVRRTRQTRLWTYLNDQGPPIILYQYTETKEGSHIRKTLAHWSDSGVHYLHADAANNFEALYRQQPHIRAVNCWAHARRKFFEIAKVSKVKIFAHDAVASIDELFALERAWRQLSDEDRLAKRKEVATPRLEAIKQMLETKAVAVAENSSTGKAIAYVLNRWENFTRYTERGDLSLSNNAAERALRKAALGRNNFLFVGSERGGQAAAIYYSLIETAKANGIEPHAWLEHVLRELPKRRGSSFEHIKDLLPISGAAAL